MNKKKVIFLFSCFVFIMSFFVFLRTSFAENIIVAKDMKSEIKKAGDQSSQTDFKSDCKCKNSCHCGQLRKKKAIFGHLKFVDQIDFNRVHRDESNKFHVKDDVKREFRYMFRLGTQYKLTPHLNFFIRFRSNSKSYHHPAHHLGILDLGHNHIFGVDQIYGEYTLFPMQKESGSSRFNVRFKLGKFSPPWWNQSNVYLNRNIQFDGSAMEVSFLDYFKYSLAYAIIREEKKNSGFTSNLLRHVGDFLMMNHLKAHFSYEQSRFDFGFTVSHINDGKKSEGETQPITVYNKDDELENKHFESENFYVLSARFKNKKFPVHFSIGGDYLWSSADNGNKKNSKGHVLLLKAAYKRLKFMVNRYDVGDAAIPFIGGGRKASQNGHLMHSSNSKMHASTKEGEENISHYLGEFFSTDHFYSLNGHLNGYMMRGLSGFTGFLYKVKWHLSHSLHFGVNVYQLKLKSSNRFFAHKMHVSDISWRMRTYLGVKF